MSVWIQTRSVSKEDEGRYECQVSTEPKLSHFVHLIVRGEGEEFYHSIVIAIQPV